MAELTREEKLSRAFVALADTLVADFDLVDLLQTLVDTCADVLDADAAGLLLRTSTGELQVMASTTEDAEFVELVQVGADAGPCLACVSTGKPVVVADIDTAGAEWPDFREAALQRGFHSLQATPMRLRNDVIGAMNLFSHKTGALNPTDVAAAQALSDVATIGILAERADQQRELVANQLQQALNSRVIIEQAKGVIAQSAGLDMDGAFDALRAYARNNNRSIRVVATAVLNHELDLSHLAATRNSNPRAKHR